MFFIRTIMTQDLLPKFKFYQDIRIWPKNSDFDYEGWLENFTQDEQKIAQKILDGTEKKRVMMRYCRLMPVI